jgi:PadR family transcriptional regulator PadR
MELDVISSQMLKGVLEGCILKFIAQKETYAYEISRRLEEFGFEAISEGTIYPIILRLQKNNLIEAVFRKSKTGPKRKYYYLTESGAQTLEQFEENWRELEQAVNQILSNGVENE